MTGLGTVARLSPSASISAALRIAAIAVPALLIIGLSIAAWLLWEQRDHARDQRDALLQWQGAVIVAVTAETVPADRAGRRPPVDPRTVVTRIHGLGADVRGLRDEITRQNGAVARAHAEGEQRFQDARQATEAADRRNQGRQATRRAIERPGRTTGLTAAEWSQL